MLTSLVRLRAKDIARNSELSVVSLKFDIISSILSAGSLSFRELMSAQFFSLIAQICSYTALFQNVGATSVQTGLMRQLEENDLLLSTLKSQLATSQTLLAAAHVFIVRTLHSLVEIHHPNVLRQSSLSYFDTANMCISGSARSH